MSAIPDKPYFKIGEVAALSGVEPHVLRYWEGEFSGIRPQKTSSGQRLYRRRDVEIVLQVKQLLYDQGYRIEGAKRKLREGGAGPTTATARILSALDELEKIIDDDEQA